MTSTLPERDLFGVEVPEVLQPYTASGDRAQPCTDSTTANPYTARSNPYTARPRVIVACDYPLRLDVRPARDARETWLDAIWRQPRAEPSADDFLLNARERVNVLGLARNHFALPCDAGAVPGIAAKETPWALAEQIGRLARFYAESIHLPPAPAAAVESFASAEVQRDVYRATLNDSRARILVQSQAELPPTGKTKSVRYLRAVVRNRNREVYTLRSAMRKCGRKRYSRAGVVAFARSGKDGHDVVSLSGITRCGSVWSCPCCAPRIGATRAELLSQIIAAHRATGGGVYMGTFTFPHSAQMACKTLRRAKAESWRLFQQGAPWRRLKARMGFVGSVAGTEITHGGAGFHPHIHVLLCTRAPLSDGERSDIEDRLFERWASAVARQDVTRIAPPSREHGVKLTPCTDASYIAKLGLADELTRGLDKIGRSGNRTPFQIMAEYARDRSPRDRTILREYHRGMVGARQIAFSRGKSLPCDACARNAEMSKSERAARCLTRGFHGANDLRRIYPPAGDPLQLGLLDGDAGNEEILRRDDARGVKIAEVPPGQWDALVRIMTAARTDAEAELVLAIQEHGAAGVRSLLENAFRVGRRLAQTRPRLNRWLWWLDPRRDAVKALHRLR